MKTLFAYPLITEKSMAKAAEGTYQFVVPTWANKQNIAQTIGERFGVTVVTIQTAVMKSEPVFFKRRPGVKAGFKKATLRLKSGESIAEFSLPAESQKASDVPQNTPEGTVTTPSESTITIRKKGKRGE